MSGPKARNVRLAAQYACVHCGSRHTDPAHYPRRRSQGASWGALEFLPLCRDWHRRYDNHLLSEHESSVLDTCATLYYAKILRRYGGTDVYMGPDWRIGEVAGHG